MESLGLQIRSRRGVVRETRPPPPVHASRSDLPELAARPGAWLPSVSQYAWLKGARSASAELRQCSQAPRQRCRGRFHRAPRVVKDAPAGVSCEVSSAPRIVPGGLAEVAVRRFGALCAPRLASLSGFFPDSSLEQKGFREEAGAWWVGSSTFPAPGPGTPQRLA